MQSVLLGLPIILLPSTHHSLQEPLNEVKQLTRFLDLHIDGTNRHCHIKILFYCSTLNEHPCPPISDSVEYLLAIGNKDKGTGMSYPSVQHTVTVNDKENHWLEKHKSATSRTPQAPQGHGSSKSDSKIPSDLSHKGKQSSGRGSFNSPQAPGTDPRGAPLSNIGGTHKATMTGEVSIHASQFSNVDVTTLTGSQCSHMSRHWTDSGGGPSCISNPPGHSTVF